MVKDTIFTLPIKVIIVGDGGVGKSSLRRRYLGQNHVSEYIRTIGADFSRKEISLNKEGIDFIMKEQIWDLSGQPHFSFVRPMYFRGAHGIIMVFDVTDRNSFENLEQWIREINKDIKLSDTILVIFGNKNDLRKVNNDVITFEEGNKFAEILSKKIFGSNDQISFYLTSAITGENVDKGFKNIASQLLNKYLRSLTN